MNVLGYGNVGRGLVRMGEDRLGWVILSEVGYSLVRLGKVEFGSSWL